MHVYTYSCMYVYIYIYVCVYIYLHQGLVLQAPLLEVLHPLLPVPAHQDPRRVVAVLELLRVPWGNTNRVVSNRVVPNRVALSLQNQFANLVFGNNPV